MERKPLTLAERIKLAEEGLDIFREDARIFPPPTYIGENEFTNNPGISEGNARYIKTPKITVSK